MSNDSGHNIFDIEFSILISIFKYGLDNGPEGHDYIVSIVVNNVGVHMKINRP